MVKYPFWYKNYYVIRYNMTAAAILTFDKFNVCISEADFG